MSKSSEKLATAKGQKPETKTFGSATPALKSPSKIPVSKTSPVGSSHDLSDPAGRAVPSPTSKSEAKRPLSSDSSGRPTKSAEPAPSTLSAAKAGNTATIHRRKATPAAKLSQGSARGSSPTPAATPVLPLLTVNTVGAGGSKIPLKSPPSKE
jgi:hypothetical protein